LVTGINTRSNGNDNNDVFSQELVYDSTITALNCQQIIMETLRLVYGGIVGYHLEKVMATGMMQ
jgi:hypothetical protein